MANGYLRIGPERTFHRGVNVTSRFLGVATGWADMVENTLIWRKTVVTNDDGLVPVRIIG